MASVIGEAFLGKACEMVLDMAVRRMTEEVKMVVYFRDDFRWLSDQLTYLSGFLQDADQKSQQREHIRHWLEKIRFISLLAEDIFEECVVESKYGNSAQSCGLSCKQWIFQYRMGWRIKEIKIRMNSITEDGRKLELLHQVSSLNEAIASSSTSHISAEWKRSSLLPRISVGIDSKVDDMLRLLDENAHPVVAVVGMGGMGKTHLLQHVYNNFKERYEKSIWLSVSQTYSVCKLQKDLAFQINDEDFSKRIKENEVSEQVLAPEIRERLQGKNCLVVLDDVWRAGGEDDLLARLGLPLGKNSTCKIVVSTRSREVCRNLNAEIYEMHCLSDEDSWRLFCVYAFEGSEEIGRPQQQHLEELGRKIVGECGNLPLAIKTIAASLAKSRVPWESKLQLWESKLQQLQGIQGIANVDPIMPILRLSYDALPALLKQCFAYLSFFPEDEEIDAEYLVSLWIAEGFIPAGEGQQEAAWDCLYQLANLCLLQLWEDFQSRYDIRWLPRHYRLIKHCRVHDLLLDLAINVSRQNKCVFSIEEAPIDASAAWCRILLAKKDINNHDISESHPVCLRTFSLSQNRGITNISADLFTAMRGLRVLDLSGTQIHALPESIGKMKLLKVLNIDDTFIVGVPECVRHLKSLCFLSLKRFWCEELPVWISELKCLEHLKCKGVSKMPRGISQLASLRVLRSDRLRLSSPEAEGELMRVEDLAKMTQLQELRLAVSDEREWQGVAERILPRLIKMRRLEINIGQGIQQELPEKMVAMKRLESLRLGDGFVVPSWISGLANLRELEVYKCDCGDYSEWERMTNLVSLTVIFDERCRELPESFGKAGGFPQLRFLRIEGFVELEEVSEWEEGAMACLEELVLVNCPKVKKVGEGLKHLKRLELFCHEDGFETTEANKNSQEGGELWHKIKSINPQVNIVTQSKRKRKGGFIGIHILPSGRI